MSKRLNSRIEIDERIAVKLVIAQYWIKAAIKVAKKTKDREALDLADLINTQVCLAVTNPDKPGEYGIYDFTADEPAPLALMALTGEDADSLEDYRAFVERKQAEFFPPEGLIVVNNTITVSNPYMCGLILLHEARHAQDHFENPKPQDDDGYAIRELNAYEFEFRLLNKLGGRRYRNRVKKAAEQLLPELPDIKRIASVNIDLPFDPKVSRSFSLRPTGYERGFYDGLLCMQAFCLACELKFGRQAQKAKLAFFKSKVGSDIVI